MRRKSVGGRDDIGGYDPHVVGEKPSGTATVLFTDLVGSTDLLARLGEEAVDEVRRDHFALLRVALARSGGEEVKTLGDGILAVFGSASDAVACAVAMQQGVDRPARLSPARLAIRVGVALGDVSFEDGDVFGTPVVEAARLVTTAQPGQILATAVVRAAAGRSAATFVDRGALPLKGLPEPVAAYEVAWAPLPAPLVPLPTRGHPGLRPSDPPRARPPGPDRQRRDRVRPRGA